MSESKKYIHYGSSSFKPEWFDPIRNTRRNKPYGGLWSSPYPAPYVDWKQWCTDNEFDCHTSQAFIFSLTKSSKILTLDNCDSVIVFKQSKYCTPNYYGSDFIDFETMIVDGFDGMEVLIDSWDTYMEMYSWDVDSLLVFNPEIVIVEERVLHG